MCGSVGERGAYVWVWQRGLWNVCFTCTGVVGVWDCGLCMYMCMSVKGLVVDMCAFFYLQARTGEDCVVCNFKSCQDEPAELGWNYWSGILMGVGRSGVCGRVV